MLDRPREKLVPIDFTVGRRVVRRVEPIELGLRIGERLETPRLQLRLRGDKFVT